LGLSCEIICPCTKVHDTSVCVMKIESLKIYPIKSTSAIEMTEVEISDQGLHYDRQFAFINSQNQLMTQRQIPELAKIKCLRVDNKKIKLLFCGQEFEISVQNNQILNQPLSLFSRTMNQHLQIIDPVVSELARQLRSDLRLVKRSYNNHFFDEGTVLVTNSSSLKSLNRSANQNFTMDQFRPNVVVDLEEPWAEDSLKELQIGKINFEIQSLCHRCTVVDIDQLNGQRIFSQTLKSLVSHSPKKNATFGVYVRPRQPGIIRVTKAGC
jgi:uncharacterized protein YcbX